MTLSPPVLPVPLLLLPLLIASLPSCVVQGFGVPGTSQTLNGYDTEGGINPVCWLGRSRSDSAEAAVLSLSDQNHADTPPTTTQTPWDNTLYRSFVLTGKVELLPQCPAGVHIEGDAPVELRERGDGEVMMLRTGRYHDYVVRGSIDLDELAGDYIFSDDGPRIAVQVRHVKSITAMPVDL